MLFPISPGFPLFSLSAFPLCVRWKPLITPLCPHLSPSLSLQFQLCRQALRAGLSSAVLQEYALAHCLHCSSPTAPLSATKSSAQRGRTGQKCFTAAYLYAIFCLSASTEDLEWGGGEKGLDLQTAIRQVNILQFSCSRGNIERVCLRKNKPEPPVLVTQRAISNSSGVSPG